MKRNILLASAGGIGLATLIGMCTAIFASSPEIITRASTVASIFGICSMGLFFVGVAFPKE